MSEEDKEISIDEIAERAAQKAIEKVYIEIGRSVVKKALYVIGAGVVALFFWLHSVGTFTVGK